MGEIGRRIHELREERGLSQSEVANRAGLTPAAIYFIETGRTKEPAASTVAAIARAMGVGIAEVFESPKVPPSSVEPLSVEAMQEALPPTQDRVLKEASKEEYARYVRELDDSITDVVRIQADEATSAEELAVLESDLRALGRLLAMAVASPSVLPISERTLERIRKRRSLEDRSRQHHLARQGSRELEESIFLLSS